jgi:hypothetical protein
MIVVHGFVAFMDAYGIGKQHAAHNALQQLCQHFPPTTVALNRAAKVDEQHQGWT